MFTTDNQTAVSLEARGLAERMDKPRASIQPSPDILAIIQGLKRKMAQPSAPVFTAPENKMLPELENKDSEEKRKRGRPPGSRNRPKV